MRFVLLLLAACAREPAPAAPHFDDAPTTPAAAPATGARCPNSIARSLHRQSSACLDPAATSPDIVAECSALLSRRGWRRDPATEHRLGQGLICYVAP